MELPINQVIQGDCLEVMKTWPDKCVDLVVTSPPYDNIRDYQGSLSWDFEGIARELYRITKEGGVVVWVVGDQTVDGSETGTSFKQAYLQSEEILPALWKRIVEVLYLGRFQMVD